MNSSARSYPKTRSSTFSETIRHLLSLIPQQARNQQESAFFMFLRQFATTATDPWEEFTRSLILIMENRKKWEFCETETWDADGENTFDANPIEVVELVKKEFSMCPYSAIDPKGSHVSMREAGGPVNMHHRFAKNEPTWRDNLVKTIEEIKDGYYQNPTATIGPVDMESQQRSIIGYTLWCDTVRELTKWGEPLYFNDPTLQFARSRKKGARDVMEIWLTATAAKQVTQPHEDGPGMEAMIWHIFGIKLWVIWEGSLYNQQAVSDAPMPWLFDFEWAFQCLEGAKVYFFNSNLGDDSRRRLVVPGGAVHGVLSFTPCMAFSSEFYRKSSIDNGRERMDIFEKSLQKRGRGKTPWPVDELAAARVRLERAKKDLEIYLENIDE